jgi:hypothetical protein
MKLSLQYQKLSNGRLCLTTAHLAYSYYANYLKETLKIMINVNNDRLSLLLELENTKSLYYGIKILFKNYMIKKQLDNELTVKKFVQDEYENSQDEKNKKPFTQSPYNDYFYYMKELYDSCNKTTDVEKGIEKTNCDEEICKRTIDFLQFYIDINNLNEFRDNMYDLYGNIANDFNKLLGSFLCYIFYSDSNGEKFLLNSDFDSDTPINMFNEIHYAYSVVKKHKKLRSDFYGNMQYNTYYISSIDDEILLGKKQNEKDKKKQIYDKENEDDKKVDKTDKINYSNVLSFCFDLQKGNINNGSESIYVAALYKGDKTLKDEEQRQLAKKLIYPLCFRNKLKKLFERDIENLLSKCYNNSFDEIKKFNETPVILHLTDLHISKKNFNEIMDLIDKESFKCEIYKYDLMIISGDVIQGIGTAYELEENYELAATVITKIARKIWSKNNKLRNDWQKRIIIVPGNHDYAMMNELSAVQENRKLQYGFASSNEGSIMAKFTYYINFVRKLLGVPIGNLIDNRLNENRNYKSMNLSICCLNSCVKENPLRTNKVQLDKLWIEEQIKHLMASKIDSQINLCVVHHAPGYKINYAVDKYKFKWDVLSGNNWDINKELRKIIDLFISRNPIPEDKMKLIQKVIKDDNLYDDLKRYQDERLNIENDYVSAFISELKEDIMISDKDITNYKNQITELNNVFKFDYVLAGHEHSSRNEIIDELNTYVGDIFFNKEKGKLNYAVLRQSTENEKNKYHSELFIETI